MAVASGLYAIGIAATVLSLVGLEVLGWFFRNRRKAAEEEAAAERAAPAAVECAIPAGIPAADPDHPHSPRRIISTLSNHTLTHLSIVA